MTSSATARRRLGALTVFALAVCIGAAWWFVGPRREAASKGEFATLHLADPIELTDGDTTHRVTRVVVNFDTETLTLERDELTFDDYGDATRTGGLAPLVLSVQLPRERVADLFRRAVPGLYEVVPERRFRQHLRVARADEPATAG